MKVLPIACLEDNYQYLIIDESSRSAAVVDPIDIDRILTSVADEGCRLVAALITHHHADHAAGTRELAEKCANTGLRIYAGESERIEAVDVVVEQGYSFRIGGLHVRALATPPHSWSHISYYVWEEGEGGEILHCGVFTGDCLFSAGCGFFREGPPAEMHDSLNTKLASLPNTTLVYPGHEYTVANLEFAKLIESENEAIDERLAWAEQRRTAQLPTIPSTMGDEKRFNPYMRVERKEVQVRLGVTTAVEAMATVRRMKNEYNAKIGQWAPPPK